MVHISLDIDNSVSSSDPGFGDEREFPEATARDHVSNLHREDAGPED